MDAVKQEAPHLVGVRVIDNLSGETSAEYRISGGKAVAVVGGDTVMCMLANQGIWLRDAHEQAAIRIGSRFGIQMTGEGPYTPDDGERFLVALMADRITHRSEQTEPIFAA